MHCCVCLTVVSGDTKANLQKLEADMVAYAVGRRYPTTPPADPFDYYVLAFGGVVVTSGTNPKTGVPLEVRVGFVLGYNQDVPAVVQNEIATIQPFAEGTLSPNPPLARTTLTARLHQRAAELGCDRVWDVKPGDDVTTGVTDGATLLAKFTPLA